MVFLSDQGVLTSMLGVRVLKDSFVQGAVSIRNRFR